MLLCDHEAGHGLFVSRGGRETGLVVTALPQAAASLSAS